MPGCPSCADHSLRIASKSTAIQPKTCVLENGTTINCTCPEVDYILYYMIVTPEKSVTWGTKQILSIVGALFLVCLSALFSGLTLGLLGLDTTQLEILKESGGEKERHYAARILPVRRRGNLLLCTLLLGNVMVNAGISVLTADITSGFVGFVLSSAVIVVFGEILPQSVCSRYGLLIGAHTIWLVYIVMALLFVIAFPISFILDKLLGKEIGTVFSKEELKKLVELQAAQGHGLNTDEARIVGGALELNRVNVSQVMTPVERSFMLEINEKLNSDTMTDVWQTGHSRIPVYQNNKNNIVGLLFTKDLVLINPEEEIPLSTILTFYGREVLKVYPDQKLDEILKMFKTGRSHLAIVHEPKEDENGGDPYYETLGLVTLEDIIEEILREEIVDETDVFIDNQTGRRVHRDDAQINMFLRFNKSETFRRLTPKQVLAATSYLYKSLDLFRYIPEAHLQALLGRSRVIQMKQDSYIYEKNQESDIFCLILQGRVEVKSGIDNFVSENGPWSFLGVRALTQPHFLSDFSAKCVKDTSFVSVSRNDFVDFVKQLLVSDTTFFLPKELEWIQAKSQPSELLRNRSYAKTIPSPKSIHSPNRSPSIIVDDTSRSLETKQLIDDYGDVVVDVDGRSL
ncbi:metal transporter [Acrasis kona]|uniref:Metal transporter n=1 Tax=Acrasis kona TaxID=1008807 RepID=A0AAW2YRG0_9EUKA